MNMLYPIFLILSALEMLWELHISSRNSGALQKEGAIEIAPKILAVMTLLYLLMFAGSFIEFLLSPKNLPSWWVIVFLCLFVIAKSLKLWAVKSLGRYWTMKVLIIPETKVVTAGPYKWIRHPNYIAVALEIAAITLLGKSFLTFAIIIVCFSIVLALRIQSEEDALANYTDYSRAMISKKRFLP